VLSIDILVDTTKVVICRSPYMLGAPHHKTGDKEGDEASPVLADTELPSTG
jgi:hypothetical protein